MDRKTLIELKELRKALSKMNSDHLKGCVCYGCQPYNVTVTVDPDSYQSLFNDCPKHGNQKFIQTVNDDTLCTRCLIEAVVQTGPPKPTPKLKMDFEGGLFSRATVAKG